MRLIALQEFPYDGKSLKPGDPFDASDDDAFMLKGFGKARGEDEQASEQQPAPPAPRKKRTYRRRDMRAENSGDLKLEGEGS